MASVRGEPGAQGPGGGVPADRLGPMPELLIWSHSHSHDPALAGEPSTLDEERGAALPDCEPVRDRWRVMAKEGRHAGCACDPDEIRGREQRQRSSTRAVWRPTWSRSRFQRCQPLVHTTVEVVVNWLRGLRSRPRGEEAVLISQCVRGASVTPDLPQALVLDEIQSSAGAVVGSPSLLLLWNSSRDALAVLLQPGSRRDRSRRAARAWPTFRRAGRAAARGRWHLLHFCGQCATMPTCP